jgi:hypothetical protein
MNIVLYYIALFLVVLFIFLSHDVDWSFNGPGRNHILARKDRFEEDTLRKLDRENPYNNIHDYIAIEEDLGLRSTFFFRTNYENGRLIEYEDDIQALLNGGWEVGLHCDPFSVDNFDSMRQEKKELESITKNTVKANRSHHLAFSERLPSILNELGFVYDSSVMKSVHKIDNKSRGYLLLGKIIEFPITVMDAYLFTYMHITEDHVINTFRRVLESAIKYNNTFNIVTIIWHANVLKMKGGRKYKDILEYLSGQKDVRLIKGIELAGIINARSKHVVEASTHSH